METKPWYLSKTVWAALVSAVAAALSLIGHSIDPGTQAVLVNDLTASADLVATVAGIIAAVSRTQATTTIGGKK